MVRFLVKFVFFFYLMLFCHIIDLHAVHINTTVNKGNFREALFNYKICVKHVIILTTGGRDKILNFVSSCDTFQSIEFPNFT